MKIIHYGWLLLLLCIPACHSKEQTNLPIQSLITKTCDYLWQAQNTNGSWSSKTHGLLKGGQAYTAFILYTLLQVPDSLYPKSEEKVENALAFMRAQINEEGVLGLANPLVLEYPNYATAFALQVFSQVGNSEDKALILKMANYLKEQQWTEYRQLTKEDFAYGGWGFGETHLGSGGVGHVDISQTRRVLQALRATESGSDSLYLKAQVFLRLLQKHFVEKRTQPGAKEYDKGLKPPYDGGFYYSPIVLGANKAGQQVSDDIFASYYRSYATATCDGLLALLASGKSLEDEQVKEAKRWLMDYPDLLFPGGIPKDDPGQWHRVLVLYHLSVRAEAYKALKLTEDWQSSFIEILGDKQQEDGSFANPEGARNKENDPLLGSTLALIALIHCL